MPHCSDFCGDADTEDQPAYFFGGSAFWKHAAVFCNFGFMVCTAISSLLFEAVSAMVTARVETKLSLSVEAATMMRVMSLPAGFFRKYSAGELSSRASQINSLCNMLVSTVFTTGITSVFSLIYISQIFAFAPALVAPALTIVAVTVAFSVISSLVQMGISRRQMELAGKKME